MAAQWVPAVNANPGVSAAHSSFPDTKCRCPPALGFLYLLSPAQRCASTSPPAPLQPATADVPRLSLAPEPRSLPPPAPGPAGSDPGTALACPRSLQRQTGPATLHAGAPKWHRVTDTLPHFPSLAGRNGLGCCEYVATDNRKHSGMQDTRPGSSQRLLDAGQTPEASQLVSGRGVGGEGGTGPGPGQRWALASGGSSSRYMYKRLMSDLFIFLQLCVIDLSDLGQFGSVI